MSGSELTQPSGSPSGTPETDILWDHCHIDNTPAPEAIETWVEKCRKLERERNEARREILEFRNSLGCAGGESWQMGLARLWEVVEAAQLLSENDKITNADHGETL